MVEWWACVCVVIGVAIIVIGRFSALGKFKRHEYGWYRRGYNDANAKAHCFLFTGERVPRISFNRYLSFCRRIYLHPFGNWERIEDPSPDIMCSKCMDYIRKKKQRRNE